MIIKSVSFQNFYSFKDKVTMNFLVNDKAPKTHHFAVCGENKRFSKVSSVYGANGSGKSNLILGFKFLKKFISESFSYSYEGFERFYPFTTTENKPSVFEAEFYIDGVFYKFSLKIDSDSVLSELLQKRSNKRLMKLYSRKIKPDESHYRYQFEAKNIDVENDFIKQVRPNASIISTARQYNHPELTKVREAWFNAAVDEADYDYDDTSEFYHKNEEYFLKTKEFLKQADLGLSDIQIHTEDEERLRGSKKTDFHTYGIHKSKGKPFKLPLSMESSGTIHLYDLLSFIFPALKNGSICLIDEIEDSLHPNILPAVIDLFISPETNPKKAQLIFTTHLPTLMNDLCKQQIFLVKKNQECESKIYRLDEVQGLRSDDNFSKKYLAGAYGGIPDIGLFDKS